MTPLTLNTDRGVDGTPRVTAAGEIDISNIHVFTEALTTASDGNSKPITVDMSAVKYLDSAGVNVLFKHADEIDRLHLIVHPLLVRVLAITGLSEIATVESAPSGIDKRTSPDSGLAAFEPPQVDNPVRHTGHTRGQQRHGHHGRGGETEHPMQRHVHEQGHHDQNCAGCDQHAGTGHRSILLSVNGKQTRPRYFDVGADGAGAGAGGGAGAMTGAGADGACIAGALGA